LPVSGARNQRNDEKQSEEGDAKMGDTFKFFKQRIAHDDKNKKTMRYSPAVICSKVEYGIRNVKIWQSFLYN
jgi:hypothetical protein